MTTIVLNCRLTAIPETIFDENEDIDGFICPLKADNGDNINFVVFKRIHTDIFNQLLDVVKGMLFISDIPEIQIHRMIF